LVPVHGTQLPELQTFLLDIWLQSASATQGLHVPAMHKEADSLVQSVFDLHWTQMFFDVSQSGVVPEQFASLMH
jgi:hypothetical protein